jgi:diadenylate cyclase
VKLEVARYVVLVREIHPRLDLELLGRVADQALERLVDRHVAAPLVGNRHAEPTAVEDRPKLVIGQGALRRATPQPRQRRVEHTTHRQIPLSFAKGAGRWHRKPCRIIRHAPAPRFRRHRRGRIRGARRPRRMAPFRDMRTDPRADKELLEALRQVAPGTALRAGIDDIIRARLGALLVIGEPSSLSFLFSGGMRLDLPFTAQSLYELAKMDGAIIVNAALSRLVYANVQLMPDPAIPSSETGTRHRTAERVAKQTAALVVSISQQRETVTIFQGDIRYQLGEISDVLARTNQAIGTLETYRQRLDQGLTRLTALEFQGAVTLDDVFVVLQRAEMTTRMGDEIERNCIELGQEGRLIRRQLDDLMEDLPRDKAAVVYDYEAEPGRAAAVLERLAEIPFQRLLATDELTGLLGYVRDTNPLDIAVAPRGYRVLQQLPRIPESVVRHVVRDFGSLDAIIRASHRDLEAVDGVGAVRAREIREGLRRLQEHNLVDRYLQL